MDLSEKVFMPSELSNYLRVPESAVLDEIRSGRLPAISIGSDFRILESSFSKFLRSGQVEPIKVQPTALAGANDMQVWLELKQAPDYEQRWPSRKSEEPSVEIYRNVVVGPAGIGSRRYVVTVGFTNRTTSGRQRRRSLVKVDGYPTVEFVAADDSIGGTMASVIRGRDKKLVTSADLLPEEYGDLPVGPYSNVVVGPGAFQCLAVICTESDIRTMVHHALIRSLFREEREKS